MQGSQRMLAALRCPARALTGYCLGWQIGFSILPPERTNNRHPLQANLWYCDFCNHFFSMLDLLDRYCYAYT